MDVLIGRKDRYITSHGVEAERVTFVVFYPITRTVRQVPQRDANGEIVRNGQGAPVIVPEVHTPTPADFLTANEYNAAGAATIDQMNDGRLAAYRKNFVTHSPKTRNDKDDMLGPRGEIAKVYSYTYGPFVPLSDAEVNARAMVIRASIKDGVLAGLGVN